MAQPTIRQILQGISDRRISVPLQKALSRLMPDTPVAIAAGSTYSVKLSDNRKIINLDTLTGSTVTLPASEGNQNVYRFRVSVLATSNSHIIKVANSTDIMNGFAFMRDDTADNAVSFFTTSTSDTITLNRTTTGSVVVGEYIEIEDTVAGTFLVRAFLANSGASATPFSATV